MSYQFGNHLRMTIFGESHQKAVGVVLEGLPAGKKYPTVFIQQQLARRAPGQQGTTKRKESDEPQVLCGVMNDYFTGSALAVNFYNQDTRSQDYPKMFRPSHVDYFAEVKFHGFQDSRGGGQFSGRLTLPLVYAGSIAQSLLADCGIYIGAHLTQVGKLSFPKYQTFDKAELAKHQIPDEVYPYLASLAGDSVGARIEACAIGVPIGVGEPFFDSMESRLSHLLFSIPGLKGVLFGDGLTLSEGCGSQLNDCFQKEGDLLKPLTNHNGGIVGGMSTGMPIVLETVFKPTPSIALPQYTYDPNTDEMAILEIKGRHDPCIGLRAIPVVEACVAFVIYDLLMEKYGNYENLEEALNERIG